MRIGEGGKKITTKLRATRPEKRLQPTGMFLFFHDKHFLNWSKAECVEHTHSKATVVFIEILYVRGRHETRRIPPCLGLRLILVSQNRCQRKDHCIQGDSLFIANGNIERHEVASKCFGNGFPPGNNNI